jgi:formylglycine-generating enzyme required for sulfatase activity
VDVAHKAKHPVCGVNWNQAVSFCEWLNAQIADRAISPLHTLVGRNVLAFHVRLPSEVEWEKAARGTEGRLYPWGNRFDSRALNFRTRGTTPVGQFSPQGDSPFGCADVAGNVWEWTSSLFWRYPYRPDDGREDMLSQASRVLRGGSYHNKPNHFRCANRVYTQPTKGDNDFGFRIVLSWFPLSNETS